MYAQTNVQLFNQLKREGYSATELGCILYTYEFSVHVFTGCFQPSGNVFLSHLVRTASILSSLHAPAEVVAAGLIHSIYAKGDLGFVNKGISDAKRKQVRRAVGERVEEYVALYRSLRWNTQTIPALYGRIDALDQIDKNLILMKLANELEHHLDLELLYYRNTERQRLIRYGDLMIQMAEKLGFPTLAANLAKVFREAISAEIPVEIRRLTNRNRSFEVIRVSGKQEAFFIIPKSYNKRLSVLFGQELSRLLSSMKSRKIFRFRSYARRLKNKVRELLKLYTGITHL